MSFILGLFKKLPVFIYDFFISTFLTISAHLAMVSLMNFSGGNFLDIGCGTGAPLKQILPNLRSFTKIIGIDMHQEYSQQAMQRFQGDKQVEIYHMDYYKIKQYLSLQYRMIFFSFSFMLMPNPQGALQLAKELLEPHQESRISFILTLNKRKNTFMNKLKPLIHKITSIDFGNVVYEEVFHSYLEQEGLEVIKKERIRTRYNLLLLLFPVYYVECRPKTIAHDEPESSSLISTD